MRAFEGFDGRTVIMASDGELNQAYDFVAELGDPAKYGRDGFVLLGTLNNGSLTAAFNQDGHKWTSVTAKNLSAGQLHDEVSNTVFIISDSASGLLLYFKAVSLDLYYPDLESDLWYFTVGHHNPDPNNLSPVGRLLKQIIEAFPGVTAPDTDKLTFAEAIEVLMQGVKWHTSEPQLRARLSAHHAALHGTA